MATKKKIAPRKKKDRRKGQRRSILTEFKKILVGIAILIFVCLTIAMIADIFLSPKNKEKKRTAVQNQPPRVENPVENRKEKSVKKQVSEKMGLNKINILKEKAKNVIKYEVFKDIDHTVLEKPTPPKKVHIPKIAIIIDDIGYDKKISLALGNLNSNITFSVLPFAPFGKFISEKLYAKGSQLMLHLPMEPVEYPQINPGPGAILSSMSPDVLIDQLEKNIRDIPHIDGVNNHMGSKLTARSDQMNQIFSILKKENLFFVDSRTSAESQCRPSARLLKVKFARRDVFLDNIQNTDYIAGQLKKLVALAQKNGSAIGIGHPYDVTLETLSKHLPELKSKVEIVRASVLTATPE
ncbi:MAG: divergent polysaccharide deacetylase family protein [Desulfobacula sp.]|nr:divergent polysaccharide deacetylase family protein [Desulfobacula sp.]